MPSVPFRFALALPLLALAACGSNPSESEEAAATPTAPASEWVEPNPTDPAVPVKLPDTPMTNAPPTATPAP